MIDRETRVYVAGHRGLVGSAILRRLQDSGFANVLTVGRDLVDLTRQEQVERWFADQRVEYFIIAAGRVGGIHANNSFSAEFIYENLMIESNLINTAFRNGVTQGLFLGSSCIYPRDCPQPMREEYLMTGPLEATNEPYAVAKIAGVKLCQAYNSQHGTRYLSLMPTNLYGQGDNFDLDTSHVLPALIRKVHEAKAAARDTVVLWGTGTPRREFLHVDDLADACVSLMQYPPASDLINIGSGEEVTISELAQMICKVVDYHGKIEFDSAMPDGTPRKLLDSSRIQSYGWRPSIKLQDGLQRVYRSYLKHQSNEAA